jgi:hypothetical protein
MTHNRTTDTTARECEAVAPAGGVFLPESCQLFNSTAEVCFSPSGTAKGAAVRIDAPTYLDALTDAHAFLVHQGHPKSATHLEPLLRAANNALMSMEIRNA